jgi:predicted DNA-binding protein
MKKISLYLNDPQITRLAALTEKTQRTVASHIRQAIDDHLDANERPRLTERARHGKAELKSLRK